MCPADPGFVIASQSADWRGNPFLLLRQGVTDSHTSDIGHWFGMTGQELIFFNGVTTDGKKRQVDRQERIQEVRRLDRLRGIQRHSAPTNGHGTLVCAAENFCNAVDKCKPICYIVITDVNSRR